MEMMAAQIATMEIITAVRTPHRPENIVTGISRYQPKSVEWLEILNSFKTNDQKQIFTRSKPILFTVGNPRIIKIWSLDHSTHS